MMNEKNVNTEMNTATVAAIENRIDFVVLVSATNCNPNGDPLNGNRPRINIKGYGEISDVCIKRKIRNRLQDMGQNIFVKSDEKADDGFASLAERADEVRKASASGKEFTRIACETWVDVRAFGQLFALKGKEDKKGSGVSVGVRGPVSISIGQSVDPIEIESMQIVKSVNGETTKDGKKSSDTMGAKHFVRYGLYKVCGSISAYDAEKTGLTHADTENIKEAIRTMFVNDSSSARPAGSMAVEKLYWFEHKNKLGQYGVKRVHDSVKVIAKVDEPESINDYEIENDELEGLNTEIIEGM